MAGVKTGLWRGALPQPCLFAGICKYIDVLLRDVETEIYRIYRPIDRHK